MGAGTRDPAGPGTQGSPGRRWPLEGQGAGNRAAGRGKGFLITEAMELEFVEGSEPCLAPSLKSSSTLQEQARKRDSGSPGQQNSSRPCLAGLPPHLARPPARPRGALCHLLAIPQRGWGLTAQRRQRREPSYQPGMRCCTVAAPYLSLQQLRQRFFVPNNIGFAWY